MNEIARNILISKDLSNKKKLKNLLYYYARIRGAKKSWNRRHDSVITGNDHYKKPCDPVIENKHKQLWSLFRNKPDLTTLRISNNISGGTNPKIIPEDIYVADVEPSLITDKSVDYIGIKSFYNRWFPTGIFPKDLLHRIDGQYMNKDLEKINIAELEKKAKLIDYPVILKPNKDSYGGMDINIINSAEELLTLATERENFVIQEKIEQHDFFNRLYPNSLNTIKVFLYRSVKDDELHILSMALRMGKDGSLDNEAAGGINTLIRDDGFLNGYAVDKHGTRYREHPNTKIKFDCEIPEIEELKKLSIKIGSKVFYSRIFALDACLDKIGNWRIIELNTYGQSIRFLQYGGKPFFGKFTEEVIDYCKSNHWALK
ncbi:sugar-transfer associated ATP-grasp domain-containing protein [Fodinibius sp. SL11]|uniref:sugar-transfer associated ATP-grasp domain-containing protein n=1 Tax=Fodinibius sp. SL11 TaxID=3425690 RepID=UPI003F8814BC